MSVASTTFRIGRDKCISNPVCAKKKSDGCSPAVVLVAAVAAVRRQDPPGILRRRRSKVAAADGSVFDSVVVVVVVVFAVAAPSPSPDARAHLVLQEGALTSANQACVVDRSRIWNTRRKRKLFSLQVFFRRRHLLPLRQQQICEVSFFRHPLSFLFLIAEYLSPLCCGRIEKKKFGRRREV